MDGDERYQSTYHERDAETGFDFRGARYYDSDVARFLSTDPLAADYMAWSTYNYVMGNPVMMVDPTGMGVEGCDTCPDEEEYDAYRESDFDFVYDEENNEVTKVDAKHEEVVIVGYRTESTRNETSFVDIMVRWVISQDPKWGEGGHNGHQPGGLYLNSDNGGDSPTRITTDDQPTTYNIQVLLDLGGKHTKKLGYKTPDMNAPWSLDRAKLTKKMAALHKLSNSKSEKNIPQVAKQINILTVDSMVGDGKGGAKLWANGSLVYNGTYSGLNKINYTYK